MTAFALLDDTRGAVPYADTWPAGPTILAVDPGYEQSAWLLYDVARGRPVSWEISPNAALLTHLRGVAQPVVVVIEKVDSTFGRIGLEVFETIYWTGRFVEAATAAQVRVERLGRKKVVSTLLGSARGNDADVIHELVDRYGPGRERAVGVKANQGPLYGLKRDLWQALAVAVAWADLNPEPAP